MKLLCLLLAALLFLTGCSVNHSPDTSSGDADKTSEIKGSDSLYNSGEPSLSSEILSLPPSLPPPP